MHDVALKDQIFQPAVRGFNLASHVCKLEANDRMVDKLFTESAAFVRIFDRLFVANAGETNALDDYAYPLVIEIGHDDW